MQSLIRAAKYRSDLASLAAITERLVELAPPLPRGAVVYPIPLTGWRLLQRGYNQASVLAAALAVRDGLAVDEVSIHKYPRLPRQSSLQAAERRTNARRMFSPSDRRIAADAVIVDDVITTGATVTAFARALRRSGAGHVTVVALAGVV